MTNEEKKLLTRCLELTKELARNKPEKWRSWDLAEWQEQRDNGPRYAITKWFGVGTRERDRVRYRRAIDRLEDAGLVVSWRAEGVRLTHLGLTKAGREQAEKLRPSSVLKEILPKPPVLRAGQSNTPALEGPDRNA